MKNNLTFSLLISAVMGISYGQNIVRNPGFENGPALCNPGDPNANGPFYLAQNYADYWTGINPAEPGNYPVNTGNIRQNAPACTLAQFPAGMSAGAGNRSVYINLEHYWDIHDSRAIGQFTTGTVNSGTYKVCLAAVGFPNLPYQVPNKRNTLQVILIKNSTGQEKLVSEFNIPRNTGTQTWNRYGNSFTLTAAEAGTYDRIQLRMKPAPAAQYPSGTPYSEGVFIDDLVLGPVASTSSPCDGTYDLAAFDNNTDIGAEPYDPGANWQVWQSNDLWNRATNGGSVNNNLIAENVDVAPGHHNLLRFRVRNIGVSKSSPSHARLYWTVGTTGGEPWPGAWDGSLSVNSNGQTTPGGTPVGGEIKIAYPTNNTPAAQIPLIGNGAHMTLNTTYSPGGFNIPALNPGEEYIINSLWDPKAPEEFGLNPGANPQICFLARIADTHDPMYDERITGPSYGFSDNVRNNNNIVTRNSTFINLSGGGVFQRGTGTVFFSNYTNEERRYDFSVRELSSLPFSLSGEVILTLDENLFTRWEESGFESEGIEVLDWEKRELKIMDINNARLKNISLQPGEYRAISLSFVLTQNTGATDHFHFVAAQNITDSPDEEYGTACNFMVAVNDLQQDPGEGFPADDGEAAKSTASASVFRKEPAVSPNPSSDLSVLTFTLNTDTFLTIEILDTLGKKVKTVTYEAPFKSGEQSVKFTISDLGSGMYRLLIHSPSERRMINIIRK